MKKITCALFCSVGLFLSLFSQAPVEGKLAAHDSVRLSVIRIFPDSFPNVSIIFKAETPSGNAIWNLSDTSVTIAENGKPCKIISVEKVSDNKLVNTALVIDHSGSMRMDEIWKNWSNNLPPSAFKTVKQTMREYTNGEANSDSLINVRISPPDPEWYHMPLWYAQHAALDYIASVDSTKDPIAVIGFSDDVDAYTPLTRNHALLNSTINGLSPVGGTDFYDAVDRSLDLLEKAQGIKAVIAMTDGKDNRSRKTLQMIIDKAKKLSIPVYVVALGDVNKKVLQKLADETGGTFYFTNDKKELSSIYLTISKQIQSVYEVIYQSATLSAADTNRDLTLHFDIDGEYLDSRSLKVLVPQEVFKRLEEKKNQATVQTASDDSSSAWPYVAGGLVIVLAGAGTIMALNAKKKNKNEAQLLITNIFPNPTAGPVTFQFQNNDLFASTEFSITDMNGQTVMVISNPAGATSKETDLSGLPSGNYLVILRSWNSTSPGKRIVVAK